MGVVRFAMTTIRTPAQITRIDLDHYLTTALTRQGSHNTSSTSEQVENENQGGLGTDPNNILVGIEAAILVY